MSTPSPTWTDGNLAHHHAKRLRENPGCFEDLLGVTGRAMTRDEYRERSFLAITGSWCEYEAEGRDYALSAYLKARVYYVDDELIVAITDLARSLFVACFHEHFDDRRGLHGRYPGNTVSVAQRRIRYREDRRLKEKGRLIINLKVIRDG
jgi:hypothetical protein